MSGTVLREIDAMWEDEGFEARGDPLVGGQRASRFQAYLDAVDWTHPPHVTRALHVFEVALHDIEPQYRAKAVMKLERDGYTFQENGTITGGPALSLRQESLDQLTDPAAIYDHLDRISRAFSDEDSAQAIGSAKELIESTAKIVLTECGKTFSDRDDLPDLVRAAQLALAVHPTSASPGPDGSDAVKKILGGAANIALGIAELRNRGYGTGHGLGQRRVGLSARHARLSVTGARMWCEFMLDTLQDPNAPWRRTPSST